MDIKLEITLKDKDYGFSDLLDGRELNIETKREILDLVKEDIGYAFDQQIEVKQLTIPVVSRSNAIDYAEGFELAMDFIDKHSADPDITDEQLKAWVKLQSFVNKVDCKK